MTETVSLLAIADPRYYYFGLVIGDDPRLYRVAVHRVCNRGRDEEDAHLTLPRQVIERANLVVNLSLGTYVKNRWERLGEDRPPVTLLSMFWAVDQTQVVLGQSWHDWKFV